MEIVCSKKSKILAKKIGENIGCSVYVANVKKFNNAEMCVSLPKTFTDVLVIFSTVTNDDWIELFLLLDALRDSRKIYLCLPFMGYARQDKSIENTSFSARMFSQILDNMNLHFCILIDNHTDPMLKTRTTHLSAQNLFIPSIASKYLSKEIVIVSPDIGGLYRANLFAQALGCELALCNKSRNVFGDLKEVTVLGDVNNKICILVDDMIDSGATLCHTSNALLNSGCSSVLAYATHGVFSEKSVERLEESSIAEIVVTDTISRQEKFPKKIRELSVASLITETIQCIL